jgi:hypothetical protein
MVVDIDTVSAGGHGGRGTAGYQAACASSHKPCEKTAPRGQTRAIL